MAEMFDPAAVKKRAEENPLANIGSQRQCTKDIFMLVEALEKQQFMLGVVWQMYDIQAEALEEAQKRRDEWRTRAFRLLPSDTDEDDMGELWSEFAEEAQRKLEAVRREAQDWADVERAWYCRGRLDRILRGSKEE